MVRESSGLNRVNTLIMRNIALCFATLLAFVGCTNDIDDGKSSQPAQRGDYRICIGGAIEGVETRVSADKFEDGDCVGVYVINYSGGKPQTMLDSGNQVDNAMYSYDAAADSWTTTPERYYRDKITLVDIVGYYPYMSVQDVDAHKFTVANDQRAEGYEASDLLWGRAVGIKPTESQVELSYRHVMSSLTLKLIEGEGWGSAEWGSADVAVSVVSTIADCQLNLSTGAVSVVAGSATTGITPRYSDGAYHAIVAPQTIAASATLFNITIDGVGYIYRLTEGVTFEAGKHYTFNVTLDKKSATALTGTVIGTRYSVDYNTFNQSETVNTKDCAFDGDLNTYFASYERSNTWVGLDLGEKHIITMVGYAPRPTQPGRVELALIEGANNADFSDALPIYIIKESAPEGVMTYADVSCSRGFRYVRYVTPNDCRCNIAELEFYGIKGEGDDSKLYQLTNLPTVVINTEGAADIVSKEYEINSTVYIISENGTNLLCDTETAVRGRGNASWDFPKKPYRLKFSKKRSPLDAPAKAKKWTLISNYGDKSLMRNILAFEVSRRVGLSYTPYCHPVDVILNGEYKGCYQLCDQIEVAENRVDITEMEATDTSGENLTGGYLIEIDAYAYSESSMFVSNQGIPVTIKSPDDDEIVPAQSDYIRNFFNTMESAIFANNYTDATNGYRKYLDLDSFLRFFIVGEFAGNTDTYWSVYMYKDRNSGKLFTGPIWDYDLAFDNDYRTYPINNLGNFIYASNGSVAEESVRDMVTRIVTEDKDAHARLNEIWEDACANRGITEASLLEFLEEQRARLNKSQELNFKRWKILNEYVHMNPATRGSYDAEVDAVADYIKNRITTFDYLLR